MKTDPANQWTLNLGCHRGTLISRDSETEKHDSLEECRRAVDKAEAFWRPMGYFVWFATATSPTGETFQLHHGTPYR